MAESRAGTLVIHTPEGVSFSLPLAGPVTRFFAWAVDLACIAACMLAIQWSLTVATVIAGDAAMAIGILSYFALSVLYGILFEWLWRGQTIGKRLMGLRVTDVNGLRLQFSQLAIRNLLRPVDCLPLFYFVGGMACLVSRHSQRLGDFAANTVVVRTPGVTEYDVRGLMGDKYNSFRAYPLIEARLRQRATPLEAALALQALMRRDEFDPEARLELFRHFAEHFRQIAAFPEDATVGLTDEQYVRNVADTLFRER